MRSLARLLYQLGLIGIIIGSAGLVFTLTANLFPKILDHTVMNGGVLGFTIYFTCCLFPALASFLFLYKSYPKQWERYERFVRGDRRDKSDP
jgi:hypothetical protein